MIQIHLRRHEKAGARGFRYDSLLNNTVIATSTDPEHAACRSLAQMGHTGPVSFLDAETGKERTYVKRLERTAKRTVSFSDKASWIRSKWSPHPHALAKERLEEGVL